MKRFSFDNIPSMGLTSLNMVPPPQVCVIDEPNTPRKRARYFHNQHFNNSYFSTPYFTPLHPDSYLNPFLCYRPDPVPPPKESVSKLPFIVVSDYDGPSNRTGVFHAECPLIPLPTTYPIGMGPNYRRDSNSYSSFPPNSPSPLLLSPSNPAVSKRKNEGRYPYRIGDRTSKALENRMRTRLDPQQDIPHPQLRYLYELDGRTPKALKQSMKAHRTKARLEPPQEIPHPQQENRHPQGHRRPRPLALRTRRFARVTS